MVEPPPMDQIGLRLGPRPSPDANPNSDATEASRATERLLGLLAQKPGEPTPTQKSESAGAAVSDPFANAETVSLAEMSLPGQAAAPPAAVEQTPAPAAASAALPALVEEAPSAPKASAEASAVPATAAPPSQPAAASWPSMTLRLRTTNADDGFNAPAALVTATHDAAPTPNPAPDPLQAPAPEPTTAPDAETAETSPPAGPTPVIAEPTPVVPELVAVNAPQAAEIVPETKLETLVGAGPEKPQDAPAPATDPKTTDAGTASAAAPVITTAPKEKQTAEVETLSMAILSALEKNPEIQIAEAQRDDALYGVDETRAAMLPQVQLSASRGRERRTTQDDSEQAGLNTRTEIIISARQNVFDFGAAHESLRSSASQAQSAEWSYRGQIDTVAMRIAATFHQLVERQNTVQLAEENLAAHEAILRTVQTQREFGMVTGADVSRIEARLNAARSELMDRRSQLDQAREDYRRLLDRAPGVVMPPDGVEAKIPTTVEAAIALLPERNPALMQARLLRDALEQQRASQRAGGLPRFDIEMEGAQRENVGGETGRSEEARALLSMRMPLFDGGARQAGLNRLTARIRQADFQVDRARRDAEQAIRNDYVALQAAKGKVDAIEAEVAAGDRLVKLYQEQFRTGSRTVFDVLDSQQTLYQAQVKRETNRTEMRLSSYRVLSTLGSLVETVTAADNMTVRLFPAANGSNVRGGRPSAGAIVAR